MGDGSTGAESGPSEAVEGAGTGEQPDEAGGGGADVRQADFYGSGTGTILSPAARRETVLAVRRSLGEDNMSERRVCRVLSQSRRMQRYAPLRRADEGPLTALVITLAGQYGVYGYRIITGTIRTAGWMVNHRRVERIWRKEGLKVPKKQPKRRRLWLNDGSCIRLRPQHVNHVWSYDFVMGQTARGWPFKALRILYEYTRECLAILVARRITADDVLAQLEELFLERGLPEHIRSDNGPEFTAKAVREWLSRLEVQTLFIAPGSPWENGYVESFNCRLRSPATTAAPRVLKCDITPGTQKGGRPMCRSRFSGIISGFRLHPCEIGCFHVNRKNFRNVFRTF